MNLLRILLIVSIFSTSFDIFGVINLFGFNFRLTQFVLIPLMVIWPLSFFRLKNPINRLTGDKWIWIWALIQVIFIPNSPHLKNAIGYSLWLIFDILMIYMVEFYSRSFGIFKLLKLYFNSYILISIIGLLQFLLGLVGIDFYTAQWWFKGKLARINGFSYEPSYFATYLLMGFVIFSYLLHRENYSLLSKAKLIAGYILIASAIVLSSSRMGIAFAVLWLFYDIVQISKKNIYRRKKIFVVYFLSLLPVFSVGLICISVNNGNQFRFLLNGTGLAGTANHSTNTRFLSALSTYSLFMDHPFWGVSLGGVDPSIAIRLGQNYTTADNGKSLSIFIEALAASGIIGIIPFILYFKTIFSELNRVCKVINLGCSEILQSLRWALIFEIGILQLSPTILRQYFWMHIAIITTCIHRFNQIGLRRDIYAS